MYVRASHVCLVLIEVRRGHLSWAVVAHAFNPKKKKKKQIKNQKPKPLPPPPKRSGHLFWNRSYSYG